MKISYSFVIFEEVETWNCFDLWKGSENYQGFVDLNSWLGRPGSPNELIFATLAFSKETNFGKTSQSTYKNINMDGLMNRHRSVEPW